eukprot:TRINITY_DN772_c0_g1_i2.p1 TRINITY_DN772_c0_g1~~TRINITY_DN772_c0_g1_i2.p1  ORF type:complete len:629 (+),score=137.90 TRINITY_DN772_c0_g1_i2:49-1935(+)
MSSIASKYKQFLGSAKEIALEKSQQAAKKISLAKQMMKEGTGQIEATSENPLITSNFEKVEFTRDHTKRLYKTLKEVNATGRAHSNANKEFAQELIAIGERFQDDNPAYGEAMARMGQHIFAMEKAREDMMTSWESCFILPMETFAKMDVKNAITSKKENYDSIRMAYDAEKTRQKSKSEPSPDQEFQALQERFEDSEIDTIELLREVNDRREVETLAVTQEVLHVEAKYIHFCWEKTQELQPFLGDLQLKIEEKKMEQKKEKDTRDAERRQRLKDKEPISPMTKLFGAPLLRILKRDGRKGHEIPILIQQFLDYLDAKGLQEEGIFRLSGARSQIERIKNDVDRGRSLDVDEIGDPHVVAGLLKMFLRELPEPLITFELYQTFISARAYEGEEDIKEIVTLTHQLPQANYVMLDKLMALLHKTRGFSDVNKMGSANLATVFGPNLMRTKDLADAKLSDNSAISRVLEFMIDNHAKIFGDHPLKLTHENYDWFVEEIPQQIPQPGSGSSRAKTTVYFPRQGSDLHPNKHQTAPAKTSGTDDFTAEKGSSGVQMATFDSRSTTAFAHSPVSTSTDESGSSRPVTVSMSRSNSLFGGSTKGTASPKSATFGTGSVPSDSKLRRGSTSDSL